MNTTLAPITDLDRQSIQTAIDYARRTLGRFQHTLTFIPEDRLDLKLAPTAKSPREIAHHVAVAFLVMAPLFLAPLAEDHPLARSIHGVAPDASRDDLAALVQAGGEHVIQALSALTSENLDTEVDTPFGGRIPIRHILLIPGRHLDSHAAQLDFIQTTWDDQENHMGN